MNDSNLDNRIRALRCWRGAISLELLSGGITNRNFIAGDCDQRYVVRVCEDRSFLGIDRRNERLCQQAAASIGISPGIVHAEDVFLVSRFVEDSRTLGAEDVADASILARIAGVLRELHAARHQLVGELLYFCPFQTVRTYTATARGLSAPLPPDVEALLLDSTQLAARMRPFQPALCHNDLLPANFLDAGARIWVVDWEYGGVGNPLFDLASISANARLSAEMEAALLAAYGLPADDATLRELLTLKTISLLREALWAVIQVVKSELEFDYRQYAADNFAAYRTARAALP